MRDSILISHATGWDDEFARWLTLQLTNLGYKVWCDIVNLYGGDWTWQRIQQILDEEAMKVIYCFSSEAERRDGCRQELEYASSVSRREKLKRFIVPIRYDATDFKKMNITVHGRHTPDFSKRWNEGLSNLLKVLQKDEVPCEAGTGPATAASWWRDAFEYSTHKTLIQKSETYILNWYPLVELPDRLYWMRIVDQLGEIPGLDDLLKYPHQAHAGGVFFLFDPRPHLHEDAVEVQELSVSDRDTRSSVGAGDDKVEVNTRRVLISLLRQAWEQTATKHDLLQYEFSNGVKAFYFPKPPESDTLLVQIGPNPRSKRAVVGVAYGSKYWHFAVQLKPMLRYAPAFALKYHVLFSDDGRAIWPKKDHLHRARRSYCRLWYNDKWRGLIQAFLTKLSSTGTGIDLLVGPINQIEMSLLPMSVQSPVTYGYQGDVSLLDEEETGTPEAFDREEAASEDESSED